MQLVGGFNPTPLKNMSSSVGIIIPNIWKKMFQTTNQASKQMPYRDERSNQ
jgi:hypothetical protein